MACVSSIRGSRLTLAAHARPEKSPLHATRHCILMRPVRYSSTLRCWCNRATLVAFATCQSTVFVHLRSENLTLKFHVEIVLPTSFRLLFDRSCCDTKFLEIYFFSIPFDSRFISFFVGKRKRTRANSAKYFTLLNMQRVSKSFRR